MAALTTNGIYCAASTLCWLLTRARLAAVASYVSFGAEHSYTYLVYVAGLVSGGQLDAVPLGVGAVPWYWAWDRRTVFSELEQAIGVRDGGIQLK